MSKSRFDTPEMVAAYRDLLTSVRSVSDRPPDAPLTSHWPVVGGNYRGDVLVVGQAVYGWIPNWHLADLGSNADRDRVLESTRAALHDRADPMSWIATSPNIRSPFWRTVQLVADGLAVDPDQPWYSRIAWANLYPVAPNEPRGNPSGQLLRFQTDPSAAFLMATVEALRPKLVLVLAGPYWWPFQHQLGLDGLADAPKPLMRVGQLAGMRWIVGWHPAGASRRGWAPAVYMDRILGANLAAV